MSAFKSKTINFSVVLGVLGVAQANLPFLQGIISPAAYGWSMFAVALVVAGLRAITTQALKDK